MHQPEWQHRMLWPTVWPRRAPERYKLRELNWENISRWGYTCATLCWLSALSHQSYLLSHLLQIDINELTQHWGLEVDRVELTLGSLLKAPDEASLIMPPSVPGLDGLTGPIQQLAMHFMAQSGMSQQNEGLSSRKAHAWLCWYNMWPLCNTVHFTPLRGQHYFSRWTQQHPSGSCGKTGFCRGAAWRSQTPAVWKLSPPGRGLLPVWHQLRGWTASQLLCGFEPR